MPIYLRNCLVVVRLLPEQVRTLDWVAHLDLQDLRNTENNRRNQREPSKTGARPVTESTDSTQQSINDSMTAPTLRIRTKNALHIFRLW